MKTERWRDVAEVQDRRRTEHRGIFVALGVNAAVLVSAAAMARAFPDTFGRWSQIAFTFIGVLQLIWIVPAAAIIAWRTPRSGMVKGLVLGAAISLIISAGYCCQETKKPAPKPVPTPAPAPVRPPTSSAALELR